MQNEWKAYTFPWESTFFDGVDERVDDRLLIILQALNEQNKIIGWMKESIELLARIVGSHSRSIHLIERLIGHVLTRSDPTKEWETLEGYPEILDLDWGINKALLRRQPKVLNFRLLLIWIIMWWCCRCKLRICRIIYDGGYKSILRFTKRVG